MRLSSVQKGFIIGAAVFVSTISISFITDSLVINFLMGYVFGAFGMVGWFKWTDAA